MIATERIRWGPPANRADWLTLFARNFAEARQRAGIPQRELAKAIRAHVRTVSRWETGDSPPDSYMLWLACREIGVRVDEVLPERS